MTLEEVKNFKSLQSYKYFTSGWVLETQWKEYCEEGMVVVLGKVRHSYAASKPPLQPWVIIHSNGTVEVAHCTCMAGLAETCSHVAAVLHWVETAVRIHNDTPCTSRENKWLMPTPVQDIPRLKLKDIDFSAPKRQPIVPSSSCTPSSSRKIEAPSPSEIEDFFKMISEEKEKKPIALSVVHPYSKDFVQSSEHLPKRMQSIFKPAQLENTYPELLALAESHLHEEVSPAMADHLEVLTRSQSKSREWFRYRAGRITASRFRQILHTDPHQPSVSLVKNVCYPEIQKFSTKATVWGCEHEKDALQAYKTQIMTSHSGLSVTSCGFFICVEHPFLGASPDALAECNCCGLGVVEVKCSLCAQESSIEEAVDGVGSFCLERADGNLQLKRKHPYYYQIQLQIFVTKRSYCDFVVWTEEELHVERIALDEDLMTEVLPKAETFYKLCILPELLGKWFTRVQPGKEQTLLQLDAEENDDGSWCNCKENKGGKMIGCDNKTCTVKWYHLECVNLSSAPRGTWLCPACQCSKRKT